jgi:hypothetical protein
MHWIPTQFHTELKALFPEISKDVLQWKEPLELGFHKYLHGKGARGTLFEAYNGRITQWLDKFGTSKTMDEFLQFVDNLRLEYLELYQQYLTGG